MDKRILAIFIILTFIAAPVGALPNANVGTGANATPLAGWSPLKVHFYGWSNNTAITTWLWNFGDRSHRQGKYVDHVYGAGKYKATVTAKTRSKVVYTKTFTITAYIASFTAKQLDKKTNNVLFYYTGNGKPTSYLWNFGDKSISYSKNPLHKYKKDGKYTVTLKVKNSTGSKTISNKIIVK